MNAILADLGEFGLIERVVAGLVNGPQVILGPGDDAAVLSLDGELVLTTDVMNEGTHFRTNWVSGADVGHRCVAGAVADIEAMAAVPVAAVIALSAPKDLPVSWVDQFMEGVREESEAAHISVVGGDLSASTAIQVVVTVVGQTQNAAVIRRGGAQPGDVVAFKGRLGWAAAGLAVLTRGFRSPRAVVSAYQRPQVPYGAGREAARHSATALIDVSDGLIADLGHIVEASMVVIDVDAGRLPVGEPLEAVGYATGRDPVDFVLSGGEDHALLGCFPFGSVPQLWTVIGTVEALEGRDPVVLVDGEPWLGSGGWSHF